MRPVAAVVDPPVLDDPAGIGQMQEPMFVEAFVSEPPVGALHEGVLDRLARPNEVKPNAPAVGPLVQRLADHLRPIVQNNLSGQSTRLRQAFQDTNDPAAR